MTAPSKRRWVAAIVVALACGLPLACVDALKLHDELNNPADDKALLECRGRGRAAVEAGVDKYRAFDIYDECTREAGF